MNYFMYCITGERQLQLKWNKFFNQYLQKIRRIALSCKTESQYQVFKTWIETHVLDYLLNILSDKYYSELKWYRCWKYYNKCKTYLFDCISIAKLQVKASEQKELKSKI